jgi:hypothetical protein
LAESQGTRITYLHAGLVDIVAGGVIIDLDVLLARLIKQVHRIVTFGVSTRSYSIKLCLDIACDRGQLLWAWLLKKAAGRAILAKISQDNHCLVSMIDFTSKCAVLQKHQSLHTEYQPGSTGCASWQAWKETVSGTDIRRSAA